MVGACMTVIGLIRVVITIQKTNTLADDFLAVDAGLFLVSCLMSYWVLRRRHIGRMHRVERFADAIFIFALVMMAAMCGFITYAISFI